VRKQLGKKEKKRVREKENEEEEEEEFGREIYSTKK
jgi:hypothetical protein